MAQILLTLHNSMHYRIIQIILLAVALFLVFSASPSIALDVPSQYEQDLLQLINEARENPLIVASSLGMEANQILQDFPDLKDILINGLPPLSFNENLCAAAGAHTQDMLENNYYSHISLDGRTYNDRIVEKGYDPVVTGESLGMLAFSNFIQPAAAVALIFKNMFMDELDPARSERRNILADDLEEAGIGFGSGTFKIDGSIYNVYLTTCDFAAGTPSVIELELLELINQAREKPLETAESMGMNPDDIIADLPELAEILLQGLAPLTFNQNLYSSARNHAVDMINNSYYSITSMDGCEVEDRVRENGYDPAQAGEAIRMLVTAGKNDPSETAKILFEKVFRRELSSLCMSRNILNPVFKEVGVSFIMVPAGESIEQDRWYSEYNISMLVCDFGLSAADIGLPYLKGRVYTDWDGNGIYSPGEGKAGTALQIQGTETAFNVYTNPAGGFLAQLETGVQYLIIRSVDDSIEERQIEMGAENRSMDFIITPEIQ